MACPTFPVRPTTLDMLMIAPSRALVIGFKTDCVILKAPVKFTFKTCSKSSSVNFNMSLSLVIPALLTRMSTEPSASIASATIRFASVAWDTSPVTPTTFTPYEANSSTRPAGSSPRLFKTMLAPFDANLCAIANPMPLLEPVTNTFLFFSSIVTSSYSFSRASRLA